MIHPHTELKFISKEIGHGVVATQLIPMGTITWAPDIFDVKITMDQLLKMEPHYQDIVYKYGYRENTGAIVIGWDFSKFVNHSFRPTCISTPYDFEIAVRDILPGEELTDDYGTLNILREFKCLPEEGIERNAVYPDDIKRYYKEWDKVIAHSMKNFSKVDQPLRTIVGEKVFKKALLVSEGKEASISIKTCLYSGEEGNS